MKMTPIELPKFATQNIRYILTAEAATAFDDITRDGRVNQLSGQDAGDWPNTFRTSRFIPAVEYLRAQRARTLLMHEMEKLMSRSEEHTSELQSHSDLVCRLLLEKKNVFELHPGLWTRDRVGSRRG